MFWCCGDRGLIGVGTALRQHRLGAGNTAQITLVSTPQSAEVRLLQNNAYTYSISGFQTFVIGTKVASPTAKPLGCSCTAAFGYFDANGLPQPNSAQMTENNAAHCRPTWRAGLLAKIRADRPDSGRSLCRTATATSTAARTHSTRTIPT
jgi:hypothetical protein